MNWLLEMAKLEFGLYEVEEIPEIAALALSEGEDTPSLRILAGLSPGSDEPMEIRKYLDRLLKELAIQKPSREQLAWIMVRYFIEGIVNKEIRPHEGVHSLVWQVYNEMDWSRNNKEYTGDSIGIQVLYGLCDTYDDLLEAKHPWDKTKSTEELLKEIEEKIYQAAIEYQKCKFAD